jgi:hypothetical protein
MVSDKEARIWAIGSIVLLWVELGWIMADYLFWSPEGTPAEVVHQLARKVELLFWGLLGVLGLGALALTRLVYGMLRTPHQEGRG